MVTITKYKNELKRIAITLINDIEYVKYFDGYVINSKEFDDDGNEGIFCIKIDTPAFYYTNKDILALYNLMQNHITMIESYEGQLYMQSNKLMEEIMKALKKELLKLIAKECKK